MCACALSISAAGFAQSTFEEGGIMYMEDLSDPSKMAVLVAPKQNPATGWGMYTGNIIVPKTIEHDLDTYEVVGLTPACFMCPDLTGIEIQAPVKALPMTCIMGDNIKTLKFPDSLEELPNTSVQTPNVENLYLGKSLKSIQLAFSMLNTLTSLDIPSTIESIEMSFSTCNRIKSLKLDGGQISKIYVSFCMMEALEDLRISGNELYIESSFADTPQLTVLMLKGVNKINSSFGNINVDKLVLPEGITEITSSFENFNGSELTLPNTLTTLTGSFRRCPNLKIIHLGKGLCSFENLYNGKGQIFYCPWNEVPKAPRIGSYNYTDVTFVVPIGMEAKYREAWGRELQNAKGSVVFREEKF